MEDEELLHRIQEAYRFLKRLGFTQEKLVNELNERYKPKHSKDKDTLTSPSNFNAYLKAKTYGDGVNNGTAWKIVKSLDELIESDFNHVWNDLQKKYVSIEETAQKVNNLRLQGLVGVWEAYSWDASKTAIENGAGYIHAFKLQINGNLKVDCATEETTFKGGEIYLIGFERACIEISHSARKAFFILHIGSGEIDDIKKRQQFKIAYADSGQYTVRAGIIAIRRTEKEYNNIECESKPVGDFESSWPELKTILEDKQFILTL